jgi:hypothetical protein
MVVQGFLLPLWCKGPLSQHCLTVLSLFAVPNICYVAVCSAHTVHPDHRCWFQSTQTAISHLLLLAGLRATAARPARWRTTQHTGGSARASAQGRASSLVQPNSVAVMAAAAIQLFSRLQFSIERVAAATDMRCVYTQCYHCLQHSRTGITCASS